jgi:hypothetical protein
MIKDCCMTDCPNAATHRAELVIYAAVAQLHPPAIGTLEIGVCSDHATDENARSLLSEQGKTQIEAGFRGLGRALPDWKRSFVRWKEIA